MTTAAIHSLAIHSLATHTRAIRAPGLQRRHPARRSGRGLSIVELMVGITIGLFILAGATMVLTTQLGDNRRLLLEAQVQQDLRTTADMISRDIRAAGYWVRAFSQVWPTVGAAPQINPYSATPIAITANGTSVVYSRSMNDEATGANFEDDVITDNERSGFRLKADTGAIQVQLGQGNWQDLTDPAVVTVTNFNMVVNTNNLDLPLAPLGPGGCPLKQVVRDVVLTIEMQAAHDSAVRRSLVNRIRLRNDVPLEVC